MLDECIALAVLNIFATGPMVLIFTCPVTKGCYKTSILIPGKFHNFQFTIFIPQQKLLALHNVIKFKHRYSRFNFLLFMFTYKIANCLQRCFPRLAF